VNSEPDKNEEQGMKLFKSKKELVVLVVSALLFAGIIYKMYLSKGSKGPAVAEPSDYAVAQPASAAPAPAAPAAAAPQPLSGAPEPVSTGSPSAILDLADLDEELAEHTKTLELTRDPFSMSKEMHDEIFAKKEIKGKEPQKVDGSEPIVLTAENAQKVLSSVPGGQKAASIGFKLGAVMRSGSWRGAVINGRVVRVGKSVLGFELVRVAEDGVILKKEALQVKVLIRPHGSLNQNDAD